MKKILILLISLILLIILIFIFGQKEEVTFKDREQWLESVPTEIPWEELDLELIEDDKASLLWENVVEFDDSVKAINHRLDVSLVDNLWEIVWYGEQYKCVRGENIDTWQNKLCP